MTLVDKARHTLLSEVVPRGYHLIFEDPAAHLNEVSRILLDDQDTTLILAANHTMQLDLLYLLALHAQIEKQVGHRPVTGISSAWHKANDPQYSRDLNYGRILLGTKDIEVVQAYRAGETKRTELLRKLIHDVESVRGETLVVLPEGHRSETGAMQQGETGIAHLASMLKPSLVLPIGIIPQGSRIAEARSSFLHPQPAILRVGQPLLISKEQGFNKLERQELFETIMYGIAETLPEEMRGVWVRGDQ